MQILPIMNCLRHNLVPDSKPRRQRGFSLWELAVLLGILGIAIVAGFTLLRSHQAQQIENARKAQLAAADHALAGFIADNGRLPCPDTTGDGNEDCTGAAQKGWLPVVTLGLNASAPERGATRLSYIVYRGPGADLTVLADRYNPVQWDLKTTYSFNQLNVLDFCAGLKLAANATPSNSSAYIPGASGATVNVAYGLAESGIDSDGDGNLFDGLNASTAPVLESPARASDSNYDDIVQVHSFYDLANLFECPQAIRSVDAISMAVAIEDTVTELTNFNKSVAVQMTINSALATAINAASIAISIAIMVDGAEILAEAAAAAIASLGLDFAADAAIGVAAAGFIPAGLGVGFYLTSVGLNISALVYSAEAIAKTGATPPAGTPAIAPCDPACQLAQLNKLVADVNKNVVTAQTNATNANTDAANALTTYNNSVTALFNNAHTYDTKGTNDPLLTTALNNYKTYASTAVATATDQTNVNSLNNQITQTNTAINTEQSTLNTDTAALNADPSNATLQSQVQNDQQALTSLQTGLATLNTQLATAKTTLTTDTSVMNSAQASYSKAYSAAVAAYPAAAQNSIGSYLNTANSNYYNTSSSNYLTLAGLATTANTTLANAKTALQDAQAAVTSLQLAIQNGTAITSTVMERFTGSEDILKRADEKGALK